RIIKLNENGKVLWKVASSGILQEFIVDNDGAVYAVGGGVNEKYDANGDFIIQTSKATGTQVTTGSIAMNGEDLYVGYSAVNNGEINFLLEKYIDQ
ncbi:MAG: redox-regulated HSP33 family molecular chaperone, partial [Oleiphilaceae bacterium]